jgi:hypothetical protein
MQPSVWQEVDCRCLPYECWRCYARVMAPQQDSPSSNDVRGKASRFVPTCSTILDDGTVVEMVHRRKERQTRYVVYRNGSVRESPAINAEGRRLVPFSGANNLLTHDVVLFASEPAEYGSTEALLFKVRDFIHRYCDVSDGFEEIASHYVLFSWIYDAFNEVPYLRVRGDFGTGKSRFLLTVGSICYKPIFASGASTVSPLFRILDACRGTLVMDEGDFRFSDERAEIVKILNNGNARGFPVLRSESTPQKEYDPRAFHVFGPKIVATRGLFSDRALESRCITEEMERRPPRPDIPLNLPPAFADEALALRNQLLMFRFRNVTEHRIVDASALRSIEPRIAQIFAPLLATIEDEATKERVIALARRYSEKLVAERSLSLEAELLSAIRGLFDSGLVLSIKAIADKFSEEHGAEYRKPVTPRWIGGVLRSRLSLVPVKSHGTFVIPATETPKLRQLFDRYGVGDVGDVGDFAVTQTAGTEA